MSGGNRLAASSYTVFRPGALQAELLIPKVIKATSTAVCLCVDLRIFGRSFSLDDSTLRHTDAFLFRQIDALPG